MEKIISFIIPSYNVEKYLVTCLDSFLVPNLLKQFEVIVVDDGSTDKTSAIANSYVERFSDTYRLLKKNNGGHGSAINAGSRVAKGKYFKVIDADDWIVTENLEDLIRQLLLCDADVVLTPFHMVDKSTGKREIRCMYIDNYENALTLDQIMANWKAFDRCMTFHGITYKRSFYNEYRHELPEKIFYEDQEYASIPCCHAQSIQALNIFVYQYLIGNNEQSVAAHNQLKRIDHIKGVALNTAKYYSVHPELDSGGKNYLSMKIQGILLSYYTTTCIVNPDKREGRLACKKTNKEIKMLSPELFQQVSKKFKVYQLFSFLNINKRQYESLLQLRFYNRLRKNHDRINE